MTNINLPSKDGTRVFYVKAPMRVELSQSDLHQAVAEWALKHYQQTVINVQTRSPVTYATK